ncbi:MAG: sporulation protein YabP [Oscillospiraceae bacterium]|nr:sporulation protein YabP [Oscillospiraceae bacterium]
MAEEKRAVKGPHNVILEDRRQLSVSGVSDIDSFDEESVVLFTDMGELTVRGYNLHINKLNVETGELTVEGEIHTLIYTDDQPNKKLFARLFK